MSTKKLLPEEVSKLEGFQARNNELVVNVGATELRIDALERQKEELLEKFQDLQKDQAKFGQDLQEKYGDGNLDLEKGEFTAAE
jgi:hypothetical protein